MNSKQPPSSAQVRSLNSIYQQILVENRNHPSIRSASNRSRPPSPKSAVFDSSHRGSTEETPQLPLASPATIATTPPTDQTERRQVADAIVFATALRNSSSVGGAAAAAALVPCPSGAVSTGERRLSTSRNEKKGLYPPPPPPKTRKNELVSKSRAARDVSPHSPGATASTCASSTALVSPGQHHLPSPDCCAALVPRASPKYPPPPPPRRNSLTTTTFKSSPPPPRDDNDDVGRKLSTRLACDMAKNAQTALPLWQRPAKKEAPRELARAARFYPPPPRGQRPVRPRGEAPARARPRVVQNGETRSTTNDQRDNFVRGKYEDGAARPKGKPNAVDCPDKPQVYTVKTGESVNHVLQEMKLANSRPRSPAPAEEGNDHGPPPDFARCRRGYALGEAVRSLSHLVSGLAPARAIAATGMLKDHDYAFVKRSDGLFSYAILAFRSNNDDEDEDGVVSPGGGAKEERMTFVVSTSGRTKVIKKSLWGAMVRLISKDGGSACEGEEEEIPSGSATSGSSTSQRDAEPEDPNNDCDRGLEILQEMDDNLKKMRAEMYIARGLWLPSAISVDDEWENDSLVSELTTERKEVATFVPSQPSILE